MATKQKLTRPDNISKAVALLGSGETHQSVADTIGCARSSITALAAKHRDTINQLALSLITENYKTISEITRLTLNKAHNLLKSGSREDIEKYNSILTLADRKEHRLLSIMGILPTHTRSLVINNLFASESAIQPEQVSEYRNFIKWKVQQDVQDVQDGEIVEESGDNEAK